MAAKSPYSPELRLRAVRTVGEVRPQYQTEWAAITAVAEKLGIVPSSSQGGCETAAAVAHLLPRSAGPVSSR